MKLIYWARRIRSDLLHATKALARLLPTLAPRREVQLGRLMRYRRVKAERRMVGWEGGSLSALIVRSCSDADLDHGLRVSGVLAVPPWDALLGTTNALQTYNGTKPATHVCRNGQNPTTRHTGHTYGYSNAHFH